MAEGRSRLTMHRDIPEEVICYTIISRLPMKCVMCLKTVSKQFCEQITNDTSFSTEQARLCPSCPALIHLGCSPKPKNPNNHSLDVLSSALSTVGIPSSGLEFLGCSVDEGTFEILASTNGLLCISYISYRISPNTVFIANPAMQQAQPIPGASQHLFVIKPVGLVFDPPDESSTKEHKFMIVQPNSIALNNNVKVVEFGFVIFSSLTGRWTMSDTKITANIVKQCNKAVYASGLLYWDSWPDMIWFDVNTSAAGVIKMPWNLQGYIHDGWEERHNIDVSNGMLMCTTVNKNGFALSRLVRRGDAHYWELDHQKDWKEIMETSSDAFKFCHSIMKLRSGCQPKFYERWYVRPLGIESGQWIYFGVRQKWKTSDRVLCYNMDTGKFSDVGKKLGNAFDMKTVYGYRNSMAALPPINVPISQDGLCDGKAGGCFCGRE
ncbi:hypothetical protein ACP4OV_020077 [Aristida adscensionis]